MVALLTINVIHGMQVALVTAYYEGKTPEKFAEAMCRGGDILHAPCTAASIRAALIPLPVIDTNDIISGILGTTSVRWVKTIFTLILHTVGTAGGLVVLANARWHSSWTVRLWKLGFWLNPRVASLAGHQQPRKVLVSLARQLKAIGAAEIGPAHRRARNIVQRRQEQERFYESPSPSTIFDRTINKARPSKYRPRTMANSYFPPLGQDKGQGQGQDDELL
ncbi:hypothetical protein V8E36_003509 [Tilletia maclaganii]